MEIFFGGTFDPIHYGHLITVTALAKQIGIEHIHLLPNNIPPHRNHIYATSKQRLEMLRIAIKDKSLFSIDERELNRKKIPSYTIDTLKDIRREKGTSSIIGFIIGQDSLLSLQNWNNWNKILYYCHLLVCARKNIEKKIIKNKKFKNWINIHCVKESYKLWTKTNGFIYLANTPEIFISSSKIRHCIKKGIDYKNFVPKNIKNYIEKEHLYQNNKSILIEI